MPGISAKAPAKPPISVARSASAARSVSVAGSGPIA